MTRQRDLYITTYAPNVATGRDMRTYTCVRALSMLEPVDLVYVPHDTDEPSELYRAIGNVEFHKVMPSRGARRAALYARTRASGFPAGCCRGVSPELVELGERLADMPGRGRVIVADATAATAMMGLARRRPVTYNAHNFESDYVRGSRLAQAAMRRFERAAISASSETWMVSRVDVESARRLVPAADVRYVPNVVDVTAIEPRVIAPHGVSGAGASVLMVGDFTYAPNRDARDLLVEGILPLVWEKMGEVRLKLAGRGMDGWSAPDPRIDAEGFVDDLATLYAQADCVVVPLTEGAGSPLKFVEALAYGVPVVATPRAARGLEVQSGVHYREGSDAHSLAGAIVDVLYDGAAEMAARGRQLAEREYSIESLAERIAA